MGILKSSSKALLIIPGTLDSVRMDNMLHYLGGGLRRVE